jgi:hypothetical protein
VGSSFRSGLQLEKLQEWESKKKRGTAEASQIAGSQHHDKHRPANGSYPMNSEKCRISRQSRSDDQAQRANWKQRDFTLLNDETIFLSKRAFSWSSTANSCFSRRNAASYSVSWISLLRASDGPCKLHEGSISNRADMVKTKNSPLYSSPEVGEAEPGATAKVVYDHSRAQQPDRPESQRLTSGCGDVSSLCIAGEISGPADSLQVSRGTREQTLPNEKTCRPSLEASSVLKRPNCRESPLAAGLHP